MTPTLLLLVSSFSLCLTSFFVNIEGCKDMTFTDAFEGKAMKNHVFKTERATNEGHCKTKCFLDDRCIAYSFGRDKDGQPSMCELCESDHVMHPEDLVDRANTVYRRAENNCQCQKYQVCRVNFVNNTHRCECKAGFTGQQCEIEIEPCDSTPCKNGATCVNNADQFNCTCQTGFTGRFCETAINYCASSPCLNGGTCNSEAEGYSCQCNATLGQNCQIRYYKAPNLLTFQDAEAECNARGVNLPSIHSAEENEVVRQLKHKIQTWMWIGLRLNQESMFAWSDRTPLDYENWKSEPGTGDCVYINLYGKWGRNPCNWKQGNGCILQW